MQRFKDFNSRKEVAVWTALYLCTFALLAVSFVTFGPILEAKYYPVTRSFVVEKTWRDGDDLYMTGHITKLRNCKYEPPPRGVDSSGENMVIVNHNKTGGFSWMADPNGRQSVGPYQISGGAGRKINLGFVYQCHRMWDTYESIGFVDDRNVGSSK